MVELDTIRVRNKLTDNRQSNISAHSTVSGTKDSLRSRSSTVDHNHLTSKSVDEDGRSEYTKNISEGQETQEYRGNTTILQEETENSISSTEARDLPLQMHHYASNKNKKYTPQFEKITSKYGLDLDDDRNKDKMHHLGRHPNEYHDWILYRLKEIDDVANGDVRIFNKLFEDVKQQVRDNQMLLRKKGWIK